MAFQLVNYKPGSYVIVEGKRDQNNFYIVMKGKLQTHKNTPVEGEEQSTVLGPGDFFGVVSSMSRHGRIESVRSLAPCTLISVNNDQFGELIQKNAPVAMKIIRSFSMKLRAFDTTITRLSFRHSAEEDPSHLFDLGEYWFEQERFEHAAYAFQRYMMYCPKGDKVGQAKVRLQAMSKPLKGAGIDVSLNRNYKTDEIIFCENEPGRELFIIQGGRVKITKMVNDQEMMLAVLPSGEIFGEMALLDNKPRTASAIAAEGCTMLAINKANFESMVKQQPQLATRLVTLLSERIWDSYRRLSNLNIKNPVGRLYDMLLTLAEKQHAKITNKSTFNFNIGGKDLLTMVGLDPIKDEKLLLEVLNHKCMRLDRGKLICMDLIELEKQMNFYRKKAIMDEKRKKSAILHSGV